MAYSPSLKKTAKLLSSSLPVSPLGYSVSPALHCTTWCRSTFGPHGPGLSNPTFLKPALPILCLAKRYENFKLKTQQNCCSSHCYLGYSELRHSTVPFGAEALSSPWSRPEQSYLPKACLPNDTDNRQQCQSRTKHPSPEPSDILKRFYALYGNKLRYYMRKVS